MNLNAVKFKSCGLCLLQVSVDSSLSSNRRNNMDLPEVFGAELGYACLN
jgi:hypothetical protein